MSATASKIQFNGGLLSQKALTKMQKKIESFDGVGINYSISRVSDFFLIFIHGAGGDLNAWKEQEHFFQ